MYTTLYNMHIVKEKTIWISKLLYFQLQVQTNSESSTVLILDHTAGELHNKVMLTVSANKRYTVGEWKFTDGLLIGFVTVFMDFRTLGVIIVMFHFPVL